MASQKRLLVLDCNQIKAIMPHKHKGRNNELDENGSFAVLSMLHGMSKFTQIDAKDMQFIAEQFGSSQWAVVHLWKGSKTQHTGALHKEDAKTQRDNCNPP